MEPMTLGSPNNSPSTAPGMTSFLPAYLMGETTVSPMPRNNSLSPNLGRSLVFRKNMLFNFILYMLINFKYDNE